MEARPNENEPSRVFVCTVAKLYSFYIAHKDVRRQNFIITGPTSATILDFGFSTIYSDSHLKFEEAEATDLKNFEEEF